MAGPKPKPWRNREPLAAGDLLTAVLERYGVGEPVRQQKLFSQWEALVGSRVGKRSWVESIANGTVFVAVVNSTWMHQLSFMKDELIERINAALGQPPLVSEIQLKLARGTPTNPVRTDARAMRPSPSGQIPANSHPSFCLDDIVRETEGIEDPELRAAIIEARSRLKR